jgi:hypothetical protein
MWTGKDTPLDIGMPEAGAVLEQDADPYLLVAGAQDLLLAT